MSATVPAAAAAPGAPVTPTAASLPRRVLAQGRFETRLILGNAEQLLLAIALPVLLLVGLHEVSTPDLGPGRRIDVLVPGVLALAVMSSSFSGQAIATGFDRRYGVLRMLGTTPLGRSGLLAGKVVAVLVVQLMQILVLGGLGLALGWHPRWSGVPAAVVAVAAGTAAFVALALLLAGTLRAEATLAAANLLWVLLVAGGGVIVPAHQLPAGLSHLARVLPSGALGEALRAALLEGRLALGPCAVLLAWAAAAATLAARWFRWD